MIPWAKPDFYGYEEKYLKQALKSTWISDGSFIKKLEKNFSSYLKSKESIAVSNGTSAIHLIYMALNLKNDEIIIPGYGYMAAGNLALQMGITPVFADVYRYILCNSRKYKKELPKKQN